MDLPTASFFIMCGNQTITYNKRGSFNDPKLNGKYLGTITKDFVTASDSFKP